MTDTKFKKGNPGKPKGAKNKLPRNVKEDIEEAFKKSGGVDGLVKWAEKSNRNREKLYDWYFKMLPNSVVGSQDDRGKFHPLKVIISKDGDGGN